MDCVFRLNGNYRRPVISLDKYGGILALVDTGARFPVWTLSEKALVEIGGRKENRSVCYGGFGGKTLGELYLIDLWLHSGDILLKDLPIVVNDKVNIRCPVILSATCFEGTIYEVDTINKYFRVSTNDTGTYVKKFSYDIINGGDLDVFGQD